MGTNTQKDALHLSQVDGVVQLRPQLHHLDAVNEMNRTAKFQVKAEDAPARTEARAVEMRVKSADGEDLNMKKKAQLLQAIQTEKWQKYGYKDAYV